MALGSDTNSYVTVGRLETADPTNIESLTANTAHSQNVGLMLGQRWVNVSLG